MGEIVTKVIHALIVLEMVLVNIGAFFMCVKLRKSKLFTTVLLIVFTAILMGIGFLLLPLLPFYGNGNGLFALLGFVYFLPLCYVSDERAGRVMAVMCTVWLYTLGVFSAGVQVAGYFEPQYMSLIAIIFNTAVFLITAPPFYKLLKKVYVIMVSSIRPNAEKHLQTISVLWFVALLILHQTTIIDSKLINIITILLLLATAGFSYFLLYLVVRGEDKNDQILRSANYDLLTQIGNRRLFVHDAGLLRGSSEPLCLVYFDLDNFKAINDHFGHAEGDRYLIEFAKCSTAVVRKAGGELYRLAGDEFVVLYRGTDPSEVIEDIVAVNNASENYIHGFLGVSAGFVDITGLNDDLDNYIHAADLKMYESKRAKYGNKGYKKSLTLGTIDED